MIDLFRFSINREPINSQYIYDAPTQNVEIP